MGNKGTLCNSHVLEISRHSSLSQFLFHVREIAPGSFEPHKNLSSIPDSNSEFSIQHVQSLAVLKRYGLMTKTDRFRKVQVTQILMISGLFGGGWRGPEGQYHKIESQ